MHRATASLVSAHSPNEPMLNNWVRFIRNASGGPARADGGADLPERTQAKERANRFLTVHRRPSDHFPRTNPVLNRRVRFVRDAARGRAQGPRCGTSPN